MAVVLIDARYFGQILHDARCQVRVRRPDLAKMLKIPSHDLRKYEKGTAPIPDSIMYRLVSNGILALCVRRGIKQQY